MGCGRGGRRPASRWVHVRSSKCTSVPATARPSGSPALPLLIVRKVWRRERSVPPADVQRCTVWPRRASRVPMAARLPPLEAQASAAADCTCIDGWVVGEQPVLSQGVRVGLQASELAVSRQARHRHVVAHAAGPPATTRTSAPTSPPPVVSRHTVSAVRRADSLTGSAAGMVASSSKPSMGKSARGE